MQRTVLTLAALLLVCSCLPGQIIGLEFFSEKAARKYKKYTLVRNGKTMICGQPLEGIEVVRETGTINRTGQREVVLIVPNQDKPEREVIRYSKSGIPRVLSPRYRVEIAVKDLKSGGSGMHLLMRHETLVGLRKEYLLKTGRLDEQQARLKQMKIGSEEWFALHRRVLADLDGLVVWLENTLYARSARRIEKEYKRWLKRAGKVASKYRLDRFKNSLKDYAPPKRLYLASASFGGPSKWYGRRTKHVRVVSHHGVQRAEVDKALILAERIIEGFRTDFIEPHLGKDDADPLPEDLFVEYHLVTMDRNLALRFLEEYHGKPLGGPREKVIEVKGQSRRNGSDGAEYLEQWRYTGASDLDGILANTMGSILANVAFNNSRTSQLPAWLHTGFGYWISFEFLHRNTVTTFQWSPNDYARPTPEEGEKLIELGVRDAYNELALRKGPSVHDLLRITITEMSNADFAKAWSFLDFLIIKHPKKLPHFLRAVCRLRERGGLRTDLKRVRPVAEELFGIDVAKKDVYTVLEAEWKKYAQAGQTATRPLRR